MSFIRRILMPIYEPSDRRLVGLDHCLWLAKAFGAGLLVAAIVRRDRFVHVGLGPPPTVAPTLNQDGLERFRVRLTETAERLARAAREAGLETEVVTTTGPFPDDILGLTRQCDLLVESAIHRRAALERLFDGKDLYTDTPCPILMTKGKPFAISPVLLVYDGRTRSNRALRWLTQLVKAYGETVLHVLVMAHDVDEREQLSREVRQYGEAHRIPVEVDGIPEKGALRRAMDLSRELQANTVGIPMYAFRSPLRLRFSGINMKLLAGFDASALLFA